MRAMKLIPNIATLAAPLLLVDYGQRYEMEAGFK